MTPSTEVKDHSDHEPHVVVFDLETRKWANSVGGWDKLKKGEGGVSALVIWDSRSQRPHVYDEHCLTAAADHLESADVVLSFNGRKFDVPVIEGIIHRKLNLRQHLDLLQMIWDKTPGRKFGNSLDELAVRTFDEGKMSCEFGAPDLYDIGRHAEIFEYCIQDVDLTRRLFKAAQSMGGVISANGTILALDFPDWFESLNLGYEPTET